MANCVVSRICESGLVVLIEADAIGQAKKITEECIKKGVAAVEVDVTLEDRREILKELAKTHAWEQIMVGAARVPNLEVADPAIGFGVDYLTTPFLDLAIMDLSRKTIVPCFPGAMTLKEVTEALAVCENLIQASPGEILGTDFIKATRTRLSHAQLVPEGGVTLQNVDEWMDAGCIAVRVSSKELGDGSCEDCCISIGDRIEQFITLIHAAQARTDLNLGWLFLKK